MEEQNKLKEDQQFIEAKQKQHQESYQKERESLAHLNWKQRKTALYQANKHHMALRPSEKTGLGKPSLNLIVKGTIFLVLCRFFSNYFKLWYYFC